MKFTYESKPIQTITNLIQRGELDLAPKYQRGYIWSNEFKDHLLFSIIKRYPIGNIILRVRPEANEKGESYEVVDGQQRLRTIDNFLTKGYMIKGKIAKEIIKEVCKNSEPVIEKREIDKNTEEELTKQLEKDKSKLNKLKKKLENKTSTNLAHDHLPSFIQEDINAYNISITNILNAKDEEIVTYFRYVQNQERLRAGEIINSLPNSDLENYLNKINDKDKFLGIFKFKNNRRQFDKAFYSILGLLDKKIPLGVIDKEVLDFVSECKELTQVADTYCKRLIEQINYITNKIPQNIVNANIRFMKSFLLLAAFGFVDFKENSQEKLLGLNSLNEKWSSFNSAKADSVIKKFDDYSNEVIEEYRLIVLIFKGSQTYERVENRMKILAYYINKFPNEEKNKPSGISLVELNN